MHLRGRLLDLGPPRDLTQADGVERVPQPLRTVFRRTGFVEDFVELPVLAERAFR